MRVKQIASFGGAVIMVTVAAISFQRASRGEDPPVQHPFWTLSAGDKRRLLEGAAQIKAGDSISDVLTAFGKPMSDEQEIPKGGKISHGRLLTYRASTWEEGLSNELYDEWVTFDLDTNNKVREITVRLHVST